MSFFKMHEEWFTMNHFLFHPLDFPVPFLIKALQNYQGASNKRLDGGGLETVVQETGKGLKGIGDKEF